MFRALGDHFSASVAQVTLHFQVSTSEMAVAKSAIRVCRVSVARPRWRTDALHVFACMHACMQADASASTKLDNSPVDGTVRPSCAQLVQAHGRHAAAPGHRA